MRRWPDCPLRRRQRENDDAREADDHALGRSRGGFSTKIHPLCDRQGYPLHYCLTAGQAHESRSLETLLEGATLCELDDEAVLFPRQLAGDKGYRADWIDEYLQGFGIEPVIPSSFAELNVGGAGTLAGGAKFAIGKPFKHLRTAATSDWFHWSHPAGRG